MCSTTRPAITAPELRDDLLKEGGKRGDHPRAYRFEELTQPGRPPGSLDKVPRARATKPADEADRIDNIVVKIRGIEEQYARSSCRLRRISPPCSIIALLRLLARPLKRSSRNSGAAIAGGVVLHNR